MDEYCFDWSGVRGIKVVTNDMPFPKDEKEALELALHYDNFDHWLSCLKRPSLLEGESTYESFLPGRRKRITEMIYNAGHNILVFNPRSTAHYRKKLGWEKKVPGEAGDAVDAFCIREAVKKLHLKPPTLEINQERVAKRKNSCEELKIMRNTNIRLPEFKNAISLKDYCAMLVLKQLEVIAPLEGFDEVTRLCLGDGKKYNLMIIADITVGVRRVKTTKEFQYVFGIHQNGYPNQIRSDFMWHRWGTRFTDGKVTLRDFQRSWRRLFHLIQDNIDWKPIDEEINWRINNIKNMNYNFIEEEEIEVQIITPEKKQPDKIYYDLLDKVFCN